VVIGYDDVQALQTENVAPYAIAGDASGDYAPFDFGADGDHTISATPYGGADGNGSGGGGMSIQVTVIGG